MTGRVRAAIGIWRARNVRTGRDGAYAVYLALMVALVTVIPVVRAAWLGVTSPEGIAAISAGTAPETAILVVAAIWAGDRRDGASWSADPKRSNRTATSPCT